jgi:hypothetical protein
MNKPTPPAPPPMRKYKSFGWGELLVNEYETVDWYTNMGKLVDENDLTTKLPKTWLGRLFMNDHERRLEKSLSKNRMLCTEWPK